MTTGPIPCEQRELRGARIGFGSGYQVTSEKIDGRRGAARAKSKCRGRGQRGRGMEVEFCGRKSGLWAEEGA